MLSLIGQGRIELFPPGEQSMIARIPRLTPIWSCAALLTMAAASATTPAAEATPAADAETPVTPLVSPDGRHIAYGQIAVAAGGEQRVRIIVGDADCSNRRPLAIDAEGVDEVLWYGNDRLAYVTKHGQDGYFLMDLDGKPAGELRMPPGCDSFHQQCLAPNGKMIAFCGNYFETDEQFDSDDDRRQFLKKHPDIKVGHGLYVVNLESQTVTQLLDQVVGNLPSWSPDSKYLACGIGTYVKDYPLVLVDVAEGNVHRPDVKGVAAGWSRDGKRLAITTDIVNGGSWLGGVPMDGAVGVFDVEKYLASGEISLQRISEPGANSHVGKPYSWSRSGSYGAVWSPDGKWIAYRRHESSQGNDREKTTREEVWIVRPDGKEPRKVRVHGADELAWADDRTLLWVHDNQFGGVDVEIDGAAALGPTPMAPAQRFTIKGRVTDGEGQPLRGVEISVATGMGTLRRSQPVKSGADGSYEVHFGPGMMFMDGGPQLQAASVYAHKPGYYERNLCRSGHLGMAYYRPKDDKESGWAFEGIVFPHHPYRLDFVMLPAARATVELVDAEGKPLPDFKLCLSGDELYPSSSVLACETTDAKGLARFADVPLKPFWFSLSARRAEYKTEPVEFRQPGEVRYRLIYDDIAGALSLETR
jgi:Tol biopolymer transport system component